MGGEGDCEELSLELSIGGRYGTAENLRGQINANCENDDLIASRCDFSESIDPQRRREIQALRRQEARRKREGKVKKSRGVNDVGFVDDRLSLEAQRFEVRERDREVRERDCFLEGKSRKNGSGQVSDELGLSLFSDMKQRENEWFYPEVQAKNLSENSNGQCSSAVSDYRSMSNKGGSSSDTGSHVDKIAGHDSSSQAESRSGAKLSNPQPTRLRSAEVSKPGGGSGAARLPQMPCVSATGNGPNRRTVTGFLYKYNKAEVSIVCVCHGRSFSPSEFVEHAGGVDVSHPLRHITVVPSLLTH